MHENTEIADSPASARAPSLPQGSTASYDAHYVKSVTEMGDRREVVLSEPIYSQSGVMLLGRGARLDSRVHERLVQHKLATPIEQCASVSDAVQARELGDAAQALVDASPLLARLVGALPGADRIRTTLASIALPAPMAFRLTLAREQSRDLFDHSIRAAVASLFLGLRAGFVERQLASLAAAALFHDIGMLHVDPSIVARGRRLDAAGRRHLYAHPLTGMLILQREPEYGSDVAAAVLEHHERLDGTGYPRGLRAEEVGTLGRVLALVEVILAILERNEDRPQMHLSLILRMQHRGFDRGLIGHVKAVLREEPPVPAPLAREAAVLERLTRLLRFWDDCQASLVSAHLASSDSASWLAERIDALRRTLAEAGLMHDGAAALWALEAPDPELAAELAGLVRESAWQLRQIVFETQRRWPRLASSGDAYAGSPVVEWLGHAEHVLGEH